MPAREGLKHEFDKDPQKEELEQLSDALYQSWLKDWAKVEEIDNSEVVTFSLLDYVCSDIGEKLAISKRIEKSWPLIGCGFLIDGTVLDTKNI